MSDYSYKSDALSFIKFHTPDGKREVIQVSAIVSITESGLRQGEWYIVTTDARWIPVTEIEAQNMIDALEGLAK